MIDYGNKKETHKELGNRESQSQDYFGGLKTEASRSHYNMAERK